MRRDHREPIVNAPGIVLALIALFVSVHAVRQVIPEASDDWLIATFAFVPARFGVLAGQLPGAPWAGPLSFVSHTLLHGDITHLLVNSAWLLAIGSPIAARLGGIRFVAFAAVCGIGGAALFFAMNPDLKVPMVGASGAISGLMAAMFRLMFAADGPYGFQLLRDNPGAAPRLSLPETFTNRSALAAVLIFVGINALLSFGVGSLGAPGGIAWEAHLGGFFTGLLTFALFDRRHPIDHRT